MSSVLHRPPAPGLAAIATWGPRLAERVVQEVTALAGGSLRPAVARQLTDLTLHGYDAYVSMLAGDETAGGPQRMAELVGDVFDDMEISLEDAMALHRHLEQILRSEVRVAAAQHLPPHELVAAEDLAHRFFNDLSAALADGWLAARQQSARETAAGEARLLRAVLCSPPQMGEARRAARALRVDLAGSWEVAVVGADDAGQALDALHPRLRQSLWGAVVLAGQVGDELVVAVQRRGARPWPDLGPGVTFGIGGAHGDARGLRDSYEQAREALDLARLRGRPLLHFDQTWFDRFLLGSATAEELADVVLAPLESLTPGRRDVALETLEAFLDCGGSVTGMAEALHMHRQSVNYRVSNLRQLLGAALSNADGRLALHVAVKARRLRR